MLENALNRIIKYSIYLLVFFVPLFWLPYTFEAFEFNKLYLVFYLAVIALAAWLVKMFVVEKRLNLRRTPLDIAILVFLLAIIITSVFSVDSVSSWLGFYGRFTDSTIGLIALVILFFVVVNNTKAILGGNSKKASLQKILKLMALSLAFVMLASYLSIFGLWPKMPLIGNNLSAIMNLKSFNTASSSLEGLAIYLAAMTALIVGVVLTNVLRKIGKKATQDERNKSKKNIFIKALYSLAKIKTLFYSILIISSLVLLIKNWKTIGKR